MAWFRVDDQLPKHRKSRALLKGGDGKRRDCTPFGLWALAGAWSNDGFVPLDVLEDFDDDAADLAARLVKSGLWHHAVREGEQGFTFHDWDDQNPAAHDSDPSTSGTYGNHVRWHEQRGKVSEDCDHCPNLSGANRGDDRGDVGGNPSGIAPGPSRPDPTRPLSSDESDQSDEPDRFDEFWQAYGKKVGRKKAQQKWTLALRKTDVTADSLIAAAASYVAFQKREGKHPEFTKDPATWLNGEHWTDERVKPPQSRQTVLPHVSQIRRPPPGLSDEQYEEWLRGEGA